MDDKIKNIAVVVAGPDEEYQYNIISGISRAAKENDINVSVFAAFGGMIGSKRFDIGEYSIYNLIDYSKFDGIILMTNTICDQDVKDRIINRVIEEKLPAVVFDCDDYPQFYNISIDNDAAMRGVIRHVIKQHGAKVLNYISGPMTNPEARARLNAFREVMKENDLEIDENRIYYGEFRGHDGKLAVETFAASGLPVPDAIICANDAMALTAVSTLEKLGYKVPEDVIVTGFDYTYSARNFTPALTSVNRPLSEAGYNACKMLCNIVDGQRVRSDLLLEAYPVFSESCGCSTANSDDFRHYKKITYKKIEDNNSAISMLNRLTAGLAETETADQLNDVIEGFIDEIGCDKFCLCLAEDWQEAYNGSIPEIEGGYSSYMISPLIWDKGKRRSAGFYPSSDMFPEPVISGGNVNYFLPLHFSERCLGYYIITNSDFPISSLLCHTFTMNISNSFENIRKLFHLNKAMEELNKLYVIDPLCNIYNRNGFINIADDMFRDCVQKHQKIMLSFIDMDGLKFINDNYGHNEGDFAIQRLASIIQECCGHNSICARFGGDEFVLFSAGVNSSEGEVLARKFSMKIENINSIIKKPYTLSASVGSIVKYAEEGETLFSIIKQADEKMYEIKKKKKAARPSERIER